MSSTRRGIAADPPTPSKAYTSAPAQSRRKAVLAQAVDAFWTALHRVAVTSGFLF